MTLALAGQPGRWYSSGSTLSRCGVITREVDEELVTDIHHWLTQHGLENTRRSSPHTKSPSPICLPCTTEDVDRLDLPTGPRRRPADCPEGPACSSIGWRMALARGDVLRHRRIQHAGAGSRAGQRLRPLMKAFHVVAAAVVTEYDGYVSAHLGDGVLAYFGYLHAHEEDAERRVRAALDHHPSGVPSSACRRRCGCESVSTTGNVIIGKDPDVGLT